MRLFEQQQLTDRVCERPWARDSEEVHRKDESTRGIEASQERDEKDKRKEKREKREESREKRAEG